MAKKRDYVNQPAPEDVKPAGPQQNVPVAAPTKVVQLTPIVQPIAFVPYSTQEQPLFMYDDEEYVEEPVYDDDEYEDDYVEAAAPVARKRKASAAAIIVAILATVAIKRPLWRAMRREDQLVQSRIPGWGRLLIRFI